MNKVELKSPHILRLSWGHAKAVVLSKGIWERLKVCPETLEVLAENGIEVEVLQTEVAVDRFNKLREAVPVGGLFHSTC